MFFCTFLKSGSTGVPGWSRDPPRVPPGSNLLQHESENDSKIIKNLTCRLSENASQRHAHWACFQIALGVFFLVCSYSCRGRFCVTFIQGKSRHSSTWLGGKTYGGCLPNVSQTPPRCLSDASQMPPDASQMLPDASQMSPDPSPNNCLGSRAGVIVKCRGTLFAKIEQTQLLLLDIQNQI